MKAILLVGALVLVAGLWLAFSQRSPGPGAMPAPADGTAEASAPAPRGEPPTPQGAPAPAHGIGESGRLSIDAASLREGEVLALGLALADEARGSEPLAVVVVSVDGRRLETTAEPVGGSGSGLRLELEPEWLRPGRYMIQVKTAAKKPLNLTRYVLEVQ